MKADPPSTLLCGLGVAALVLGSELTLRPDLCFLLGVGLVGLHRVTGRRLHLALLAAPLLASLTLLGWRQLTASSTDWPEVLAHPQFAGQLARAITSVALLVATLTLRSRLGGTLTALTSTALALAFLTLVLSWITRKETDVHLLAVAAAAGWGRVAWLLAAASWLFVAVSGVYSPPPPARRLGVTLGAAGALLLAVLLAVPAARSTMATVQVLAALMMLAAALLVPGVVALARVHGGGASWTAVALVSLQLLALPFVIAALERTTRDDVAVMLAAALPLGMSGLGLAALASRAPQHTVTRGLCAALFFLCAAVAIHGWMDLVADSFRWLRVREPFRALRPIFIPAATVGLVAWATSLTYATQSTHAESPP